jgi:hypothetical protein
MAAGPPLARDLPLGAYAVIRRGASASGHSASPCQATTPMRPDELGHDLPHHVGSSVVIGLITSPSRPGGGGAMRNRDSTGVEDPTGEQLVAKRPVVVKEVRST